MEAKKEDTIAQRMAPRQVSYSEYFSMKRDFTYNLQDPDTLQWYLASGYKYIKRVERPFHSIVRDPSIGCIVELYKTERVRSYDINSKEGQRLIHKNCYI